MDHDGLAGFTRWAEGRQGALPAEIDLDAGTPHVAGELGRAVAVFARGRSAVLLGTKGQLRTVDLSGPEDDTKPNRDSAFPVDAWMLDLGGQHVVFRQNRHDAVFSIATGAWTQAARGTAEIKGRQPAADPVRDRPGAAVRRRRPRRGQLGDGAGAAGARPRAVSVES